MFLDHSLGIVVTLLLLHIAFTHSIVLQDLPHSPGHKLPIGFTRRTSRQEDCGVLGLRGVESFLWGGCKNESTPVFGNLTVSFPGKEENVLSMQRFKDMTEAITCDRDSNTMEIAFKDDKNFKCAQDLWDWVNGADNHTFVMVAGTGDCGWNDQRTPFIISTIQYDKEKNIARLHATASDWSAAIHSYQLHVGSLEGPSASTERSIELNYNKDSFLNFEHNLTHEAITLPTNSDKTVNFTCVDCSTHGKFQFGLQLEIELLTPKKAIITMSPRQVTMDINSDFTISTSIDGKQRIAQDLLAISLGGISITGIIDIGPELVFQAGLDVGSLTSPTTFSSGTFMSLDDSAQTTINFLEANITSDSWKPNLSENPISIDSKTTGEVKAFLKAKIQMSIRAFARGYSAGIELSPYVSAIFTTPVDSDGACTEDAESHAFGVNGAKTQGVEIKAEVEHSGQPTKEIVIWDEHELVTTSCL